MNPGFTHRDTCRICGSRDLDLLLKLPPTPPGDHYVTADRLTDSQLVYPMDLWMCGACGLAQLLDVVDPEKLYGDYIYSTSISLGLVEHFDRYATSVLADVRAPTGSLIIDIGSNDGTLLKGFASRGMSVLGVDPAREVARKATEAGIETLATFFTSTLATDIRRDRGAAAIVTANNVFANIDDLDDLIEGIKELLAQDGVFVFETGYFPDLVRQRIIDNIYHEHITYYSVKPLVRFFQRHGMELVRVQHEPTKGGSIRGFVQLAGGKSALQPAQLHELIKAETSGGYDRPEALQSFSREIEAVKNDLRACVAALTAQGRTVAGYGASVGVTTLLHYFDLCDSLSFMVDDNPERHGRFTPGHHLPVLAASALNDRNVDDVVIFAWRYADPIMKKNEEYTKRGGHFIIPLPEVRIF